MYICTPVPLIFCFVSDDGVCRSHWYVAFSSTVVGFEGHFTITVTNEIHSTTCTCTV